MNIHFVAHTWNVDSGDCTNETIFSRIAYPCKIDKAACTNFLLSRFIEIVVNGLRGTVVGEVIGLNARYTVNLYFVITKCSVPSEPQYSLAGRGIRPSTRIWSRRPEDRRRQFGLTSVVENRTSALRDIILYRSRSLFPRGGGM